jgi:hypothetical protein
MEKVACSRVNNHAELSSLHGIINIAALVIPGSLLFIFSHIRLELAHISTVLFRELQFDCSMCKAKPIKDLGNFGFDFYLFDCI